MRSWRLCCGLGISSLLCCTLGVLTYLNTLQCGIVYDDEPAIKKNKDLHPDTPWLNILAHDFWGSDMASSSSHKSYRPVCVATFRLNYLVHGLEPMGYHLVNFALHGLTCLLFVWVCGCVTSSAWQGFFAGALFAVHPIHAEAVAGLVGRTELLSAIFFCLAFLAYHRSVLKSCSTGSPWLFLSIVFTLCSALSKEQGITVAAVCITYEFFIIHKMNYDSSMQLLTNLMSRKRYLPPWFPSFFKRALALAGFVVMFMVLRVYLMKEGPNIFDRHINPPIFMNTPYRQLNWLYLLPINLWQLLNPSFLCPDWRFETIPVITSLLDPRNFLTAITLLAIATLTLYCLHFNTASAKRLFFGLSLLSFPFLPASNLFFPVGFVVAERVLYIPSMGYCFILSCGLLALLRHFRSVPLRGSISASFILLLAILGARAVLRNEDWVSNLTLYSSGVRCNPNNGVMLTNLGIEHGKLQNFTFAERLYRRSIEVAPGHSRGFSNLGGLLEALKRYDEAEEALKTAVVLGTEDSTVTKVLETYVFLVNSVILRKGRAETGRYHDALEMWDQAIATYPKYALPYGWKGTVLYKMGKIQEAIGQLEIATKSGVMEPEVYYHLGLCFLAEGGGGEEGGKVAKEKAAGGMFRRALQLDGTHAGAKAGLAKLLKQ